MSRGGVANGCKFIEMNKYNSIKMKERRASDGVLLSIFYEIQKHIPAVAACDVVAGHGVWGVFGGTVG